MPIHTHYLISWSFRKAKRFYNLFISANPDVCDALYHESAPFLYKTESTPWVQQSRRKTSETGKDVLLQDTPIQARFNASASLPAVAPQALRPSSDVGIHAPKNDGEKAHETNARRIRRKDRIISWPPVLVQADAVYICSPIPHREEEMPANSNDLEFDSCPYTAAQSTSWHNHDEASSDHFQHACIRSFDSTLDSIDEDSVLHVYSSPYSPNYISGFEDCKVSSPTGHCDPIAQNSLVASPRCRLNSPRLPIPSLMLTLPTPALPQTPAFASQSPITVSKYVSASSALGPAAASLRADCFPTAPSIPRAGCCGLAEFAAGTQCSACDQQWLACKIWYQANDGGRKRLLTEPYVKPAESNARTRAIEDALGIPGGQPHPSALGLGIEFETETPRRRKFWRLSRLLTSAPLTEHASDAPVQQPSGVINEKMDFKILLSFPDELGKTYTTQLKSKIIWLFNRVKLQRTDPSGCLAASRDSGHCGLLSAKLDASKSSASDVAYTAASSVAPVERWDDDFDLPSERVLSGSKFVEHLVVFPPDLDGVF